MIVAEGITEYSQLVDVLRSYRPDPALPMLSPVRIKNNSLGRVTLAAVLASLGLKLIIETDDEQLAKIKPRLLARKNARSGNGRVPRRRFSLFRGKPEIA